MAGQILDGRALRDKILRALALKIRKFKIKPTLAIILVGEEPASEIYVRRKEAAALEIGANFQLIKKPKTTRQTELEEIVKTLNHDRKVSGIVVQKPLPSQIASDEIDLLVDPAKDVDGLNPISPFIPATTRGIFELLTAYKIKIEGKKVVVVGRSKLVGLPTALEFLNQDATVTICHSKTGDLAAETRLADILVVAVGRPKLIKANMVKPGAVVIDVGTNRLAISNKRQATRIVGDVDFDNVKEVASMITPVPGGVGPMTVAALMMNLVEATLKNN